MLMIFLNNNTFDIVDSNDGNYNGDDDDDDNDNQSFWEKYDFLERSINWNWNIIQLSK